MSRVDRTTVQQEIADMQIREAHEWTYRDRDARLDDTGPELSRALVAPWTPDTAKSRRVRRDDAD